jgi:hypothetical protein
MTAARRQFSGLSLRETRRWKILQGLALFSGTSSWEMKCWKILRDVVTFSGPASGRCAVVSGDGTLEDSLERHHFLQAVVAGDGASSRETARWEILRGVVTFSGSPSREIERRKILRSAVIFSRLLSREMRCCLGRWRVGRFSKALPADLWRWWLLQGAAKRNGVAPGNVRFLRNRGAARNADRADPWHRLWLPQRGEI